MHEKRSLECVFLAMVTWFRLFRHVLHSVNVARFHFSVIFWNRATSHTPVVARKCRKSRFGGMEYVKKPHFGRKNVARFEICPENRNRATKIRRFLPWSRCSQLPELIGRFVPATFAVKRSGESIDSGYSCESELVLHCFAERSQIQIRVFICQVSENPM